MSCWLGAYEEAEPWLTDPGSWASANDRAAYTSERNAILAACAANEKARPLKAHLNIIGNADDQLLADQLDAAVLFTSQHVGAEDPITWATAPIDLRQAMLMLAAHWYENREAVIVGSAGVTLPFGFDELLLAHRRWVF